MSRPSNPNPPGIFSPVRREKTGKGFCAIWCILTMVLALCATGASAQEYRGRITCVVTDPSGAAIPAATVTAKSKATGVSISAQSNAAGIYTITFLQPGEYDLKVTAPGFKAYEQTGIVLQSGQLAEITAALTVGQTTESIEVTTEAALLDTESASRGNVVDNKLIQELAVPARNPMLLANFQPGVTYRGVGIFYQPFANGALVNLSINGGLPGNNELQVDGAPNNSSARAPNNVAFVPPGEAVQEVAINTNGYDASFGKTSGGVVNIVMKGGTKDFHASGWSFQRRRDLNANRFQNNANNVPKPRQQVDHWGVVASGPVLLPFAKKDLKDRFFWLFSYENYNELQPAPFALSYPATEMRNGDFSRMTNPAGAPITIYDPTTLANVNGIERRTPFPGNIIPSNRLSPIARSLTSFYPNPNVPTPAGRRYSQLNYAQPDYAYDLLYESWMGRGDFIVNDAIRINSRYAFTDHGQNRTDNGIFGPGQRGFAPYVRTNHAALFDYVQTLSPSTVVNVRLNMSRYVEGSSSPANLGFDATQLGFPQSLLSRLAVGNFFGSYEFGDGYTAMGPDPASVLTDYTTTYSLQSTVSKVAGAHQLKAGIDWRRSHVGQLNLGYPFLIGTVGQFTEQAFAQPSLNANTGDSMAGFMLGAITFSRADFNVRPFWQHWYVAPFIQDDWRVSKRLSLNLGLRWDLNTTPAERYNRMLLDFDPARPSPLGRLTDANLAVYPQLRNLSGDFAYAGVNGGRTSASNNYYNTLQPRVGAAYQLSDRYVLRGGYGMFFANWPTLEYFRSEGFSTQTIGNISPDGGRNPFPNIFANPFPGGLATPVQNPSTAFFLGRDQGFFNPSAKMPRVHQFSFGVQYRVTNGSVLDASFVGSRTTNNHVQRPTNLPSDTFMATCDPMRGGAFAVCDGLVTNPFQGVSGFVGGTGLGLNAQTSRYQMNRPFPQYAGDLVRLASPDGRAWYNSAQVSYRTRLKAGLVMDFNYTFSKFLSEGDGWFNQFAGVLQRGLTAVDRTHVVKFSGHYELPFGRGKKFLATSNRFVSRLVSGWDVNTFTNLGSGEPANLPGNTILLKDPRVNVNTNQFRVRGWNGCVAQLTAGGGWTPVAYSVTNNGCSSTDLSQYAWGIVPGGRILTQTLNPFRSGQIRMPAFYETNISLNKTTQITEKLRFQFRAEAFNAFNTYNLFQIRYNNNPFDPNFGTYFPGDNSSTFSQQSRDTLPRNIQIGLKLIW